MEKWIDTTGDCVKGDTIKFSEAVFAGSFKKPRYLGDREVIAEIIKESYGSEKAQHTFSLKILSSSGIQALEAERKTRRKGRNIYKNGTSRLLWENESQRNRIADEKHERGAGVKAIWQAEKEMRGY